MHRGINFCPIYAVRFLGKTASPAHADGCPEASLWRQVCERPLRIICPDVAPSGQTGLSGLTGPVWLDRLPADRHQLCGLTVLSLA